MFSISVLIGRMGGPWGYALSWGDHHLGALRGRSLISSTCPARALGLALTQQEHRSCLEKEGKAETPHLLLYAEPVLPFFLAAQGSLPLLPHLDPSHFLWSQPHP